ncbi:MAG: CCA tRNA nucleotidyltransferase [Pseudomonadota bacterium]
MSDKRSTLVPLSTEEKQAFSWLASSPVRRVFEALEAAKKGCARLVGGCVRDGLLSITPNDIDIAVQLTPDETMSALAAARLRAEPTGIAHGTVTAIVDGTSIEVTSLRADVDTDGRHATVSFTDDWLLDAVRRDFTINAMYLTPEFELFDPWKGREDLRAGIVRFIGEPLERIREDYLRILRFFRFSARFAANDFDHDGLAACRREIGGISRLSKERIGTELIKILHGPRRCAAVRAMAEAEVLSAVYPHKASIEVFCQVVDQSSDLSSGGLLGALWPYTAESDALTDALRLSNDVASRRRDVSTIVGALSKRSMDDLVDLGAMKQTAYFWGIEAAIEGLCIASVTGSNSQITDSFFDAIASVVEGLRQWDVPVFPIKGSDVSALGVKPGKEMGDILRSCEQRWVDEGFPSEARAREILKEVLPS